MIGGRCFKYSDIVRRIACYLQAKTEQTDNLGNLKDDYVSELSVKALEVVKDFQSKGDTTTNEENYVYKSLWNFAKEVNRQRAMNSAYSFQELEDMIDPADIDCQMDARRTLETLRKRMKAIDWLIINRMAESNGSREYAYHGESETDCQFSQFLVTKAINRARKIAFI